MSDGREERGQEIEDRLSKRFESDKTAQTDETDKKSKPEKTDMQSKTAQTGVKERPSVLMYLPEELRQELDVRFDELNAKHKREHGEGIEKNRDYYPAVVEAGLTGQDVEDVLEL